MKLNDMNIDTQSIMQVKTSLKIIHLLVCSSLNRTVSTVNLRNRLLLLLRGAGAWHGMGVVYTNLEFEQYLLEIVGEKSSQHRGVCGPGHLNDDRIE